MTREENIATLNEHLDHWKRLLSENICDQSEGEKTIDALQNAIKALEQEPSYNSIKAELSGDADCIRRSDMLDAVGHGTTYTSEEVQDIIDGMPSVTPQSKMGKWLIKMVGDNDHAICSVCGDDSFLSPEWDALELYKYCPNCGAKMQEVEE